MHRQKGCRNVNTNATCYQAKIVMDEAEKIIVDVLAVKPGA